MARCEAFFPRQAGAIERSYKSRKLRSETRPSASRKFEREKGGGVVRYSREIFTYVRYLAKRDDFWETKKPLKTGNLHFPVL